MEAFFGCHWGSGDSKSMMIKKGVHWNRAGTERNRDGTGQALRALAGTEPAPSRHRLDKT